MTDDELAAFSLQCQMCDESHNIVLPACDLTKWFEGTLIQDALPYLDPDIRELMISGICGKCFDKLSVEENI